MHDFCTAIPGLLKDTHPGVADNARGQEFVEVAEEKMIQWSKDSFRFYFLLQALHVISTEFSRHKFQFKTVDSFKEQKIVKEKMKLLRDRFPELVDCSEQHANKAIML